MEQILFLVAVAVLSMLHSWWTKRKEKESEDAETSTPGQPERPAPKRPSPANWEEELRRLLEGEDDKPASPPPPVIVQTPRPSAPPPLPAAPRLRTVSRPQPVFEAPGESEVGLPVQMPSLEQSAQSYLRASQLEQRVAEHMRGVDARVSSPVAAAPAKRGSAAARRAVSLLRDRESQRAVIVAGVILGPPKALEG